MRNIKPLLLTFFAAMCIILFTQCGDETKVQNGTKSNCTINIDSIKGLKIVYVNLDTIMYRYEFALDINKEMISKEARISATLDGKRKKLEEEIADFEYRCNAKLLATEEQFIEERDKIIKKEQEFVKLRDELYMQLESENMARSKELRDSINSYILEHNQTKGYDFILTKIGDNILYANSTLDITMEIVEGLNKRYNKK
mgnify:CR=1 FL=1